jgi:hypothetical protein
VVETIFANTTHEDVSSVKTIVLVTVPFAKHALSVCLNARGQHTNVQCVVVCLMMAKKS